jgi:hypothetical protein
MHNDHSSGFFHPQHPEKVAAAAAGLGA